MTVAFAEVHQHIGAENMTLDVFRAGGWLRTLCSAAPGYGTGTAPGNERGYGAKAGFRKVMAAAAAAALTPFPPGGAVVRIPPCVFPDGVALAAGDQIRLTSVYSARTLPGSTHNWHEGVMALAYLYAVAEIPPADKCLQHLAIDCGEPPYYSEHDCLRCATRNEADLRGAGYTTALVQATCAQTAGAGQLPVPPTVPNMAVYVFPTAKAGVYTVNLTGPRGVWFALGFNPAAALMANATAFVYSIDPDNQNNGTGAVFEERELGNHFQGRIVNPAVPAAIREEGSSVQIVFTFDAGARFAGTAAAAAAAAWRHARPGPATGGCRRGQLDPLCYLFATGETMTLDYHGSTRGTWCEN